MFSRLFFVAVLALVVAFSTSSGARADGDIPNLTTSTFVDTIGHAEHPVLLEFKAKWCPYCKKMQPDIEALRQSHMGTLEVYQVDVDDEPNIAGDFDAHILPTMIMIYHGSVVGRSDGALYGKELSDWVQDVENDIRSRAKKDAHAEDPQAL